MTLFVPGVNCPHGNENGVIELIAVHGAREMRNTTKHPGANQRVQGTLVPINAPTLTEATGGRSFGRQRYLSDHD
jgi:hypothetical protein